MHQRFADKKMDAGRDSASIRYRRRFIANVCLFDIVKYVRAKLIRNAY